MPARTKRLRIPSFFRLTNRSKRHLRVDMRESEAWGDPASILFSEHATRGPADNLPQGCAFDALEPRWAGRNLAQREPRGRARPGCGRRRSLRLRQDLAPDDTRRP